VAAELPGRSIQQKIPSFRVLSSLPSFCCPSWAIFPWASPNPDESGSSPMMSPLLSRRGPPAPGHDDDDDNGAAAWRARPRAGLGGRGGYSHAGRQGSAALPLVVVKGTPYEWAWRREADEGGRCARRCPAFSTTRQASGEARSPDGALDQAGPRAPVHRQAMIALMRGVADGSGWLATRLGARTPIRAGGSLLGAAGRPRPGAKANK